MQQDLLYAAGKEPVKDRKRDPYAFFTMSLRNHKFEISCCVEQKYPRESMENLWGIVEQCHAEMFPNLLQLAAVYYLSLIGVHYCAKEMRANFKKIRLLFLRIFGEISSKIPYGTA